MTHATKEICNILAKGQLKSGFNPLALLDGLMSGNIAEAISGSTDFSVTSALYAKCKRLHTKTKTIPMDCSVKGTISEIRFHAEELQKRLITLSEAPTDNSYIAYYNKGGLFSNPTVVVVEAQKSKDGSELVLTAFTTKVGCVRGHSCNVAMKKYIKLL